MFRRYSKKKKVPSGCVVPKVLSCGGENAVRSHAPKLPCCFAHRCGENPCREEKLQVCCCVLSIHVQPDVVRYAIAVRVSSSGGVLLFVFRSEGREDEGGSLFFVGRVNRVLVPQGLLELEASSSCPTNLVRELVFSDARAWYTIAPNSS